MNKNYKMYLVNRLRTLEKWKNNVSVEEEILRLKKELNIV